MRNFALRVLVEVATPLVAFWSARQERRALFGGRSLTADESTTAQMLGVQTPERIRVHTVSAVPMPGGKFLQRQAARIGFDATTTCGLCLRYAIFLRSDVADDCGVLQHEFVHTAQYERLGSHYAFLRQYLYECLRDGYTGSALEREARAIPRQSL
jgi:hypothetical protein